MKTVNRGYVGIPSFLRSRIAADPSEYADARIGVLGVPFDEGSPFLPGSRFGPRGIREHSLRIPVGDPLYDPDTDESFLEHEFKEGLIIDVGDVDVDVHPVDHVEQDADAWEFGAARATQHLCPAHH
jgi:agmatinase